MNGENYLFSKDYGGSSTCISEKAGHGENNYLAVHYHISSYFGVFIIIFRVYFLIVLNKVHTYNLGTFI